MINLLFIHSGAELYGSDRSLLNTVRNLDHLKYKLCIILPYNGPLVNELSVIPNTYVEIHELAVLRRSNLSIKGLVSYAINLQKSIDYIEKMIDKYEIEIVDTNTAVVFCGAIASKRSGVKSVWHVREIITNAIENTIISYMMNHYADVVVANSVSTASSLKVKRSKIKVIYNAVEEKQIEKNKITDSFVVGMAGRINRWKGQKLFVDMAKIVKNKYKDVTFYIAGDVFEGEEWIKKQLEQYIEEKGMTESIRLLGHIEDMAQFYNKIDVFVLPSIKPEPFGLVVIEAMDAGIPVVATKHGGPREIIEDGITGFLVDYKNPEDMAEKVMRFIENPDLIEKMGSEAKKKKRERFTLSVMIDNIDKVYQGLC